MEAHFAVGIDLGTTQSALAASPLDRQAVESLAVQQITGPGQVGALPLLASAVYLPAPGELPEGATRLPWGDPGYVVGDEARRLGAGTPSHLVLSAKSWLSHAGVDRRAAILPWGAGDVQRISPAEASARILGHLRAAWDQVHPAEPLARQELVLTVPASFDEVARELTVEAARQAGLSHLRLLEEPQAAFLDLIARHPSAVLGEARVILVVDVGGGTTDFTLLAGRGSAFTRIAVGDHLILGGDNMDVALARHVEGRLGIEGLDATSWSALVQSARLAKEELLAPGGPPSATVTLPGRGSRLVGGSRSHQLGKDEALTLLLDGFFPLTGPAELPVRRKVALTELGLPYAPDPAVPRHLCAFLRRHAAVAAEAGAGMVEELPRPDAVLLNGGVFAGAALVARLSEVLAGWFGKSVPLLPHTSLDLSVARGAAAHALSRRGLGPRISGGTARAYYVGVEVAGERRALCVVPRGLTEGEEAAAGRIFRLVLGRPVSFPLYASSSDRPDAPGSLSALDDDLSPLPPLATVLRADVGSGDVPVRLFAQLTEIGTLQLSLREEEGPRRWALQFGTRTGTGGGAAVAPNDELPRRFQEARALVERAYGRKAETVEAREIKNLWRSLEKEIGPREGWSWAVNRELWGILWGGAARRRRSPEHERIWFQLSGFCLRPGFGAPLDDWRVSETWNLFSQGVQYTAEKPNWSEWWILWRRVAGGLAQGQQLRILEAVRPWLRPAGRGAPKPKGPRAEGHDEMLRLAASLERLPPAEKLEVVGWAVDRIDGGVSRSFWPLGRLLARVPFAGSAHEVVPAEQVLPWLDRVLREDLRRADGAAFAVARMAQRTGDRARDLPDQARERAAAALVVSGSPEAWVRMVGEAAPLDEDEEMRVFGESLPAGLKLDPAG